MVVIRTMAGIALTALLLTPSSLINFLRVQ